MWTTFLPDLIVGLIVAATTATIAVFLGRRTYHQERMKREVSGLRRLVGELARKRALIEPKTLSLVEGAGPGHPDFDAVETSVFNVRHAIDEARLAARDDDGSEVHRILDQMSMHCNGYLHASRHAPQRYLSQVHSLRVSLNEELNRLRTIHPGLPDDEPGSKAYDTATPANG